MVLDPLKTIKTLKINFSLQEILFLETRNNSKLKLKIQTDEIMWLNYVCEYINFCRWTVLVQSFCILANRKVHCHADKMDTVKKVGRFAMCRDYLCTHIKSNIYCFIVKLYKEQHLTLKFLLVIICLYRQILLVLLLLVTYKKNWA